jgi:hypothetical protein
LDVQDASSDEQKLRQEMDAKAVEKARQKAAAHSRKSLLFELRGEVVAVERQHLIPFPALLG